MILNFTLKGASLVLFLLLSLNGLTQLTWEYRGGNPVAPITDIQYGVNPAPPGPEPAGLDTAIQHPAFGTSRFGSVAFGDVDGDGDQDFFSGSRVGEIYYRANLGTPTNPNWVLQPMPSTDTIDIAPNNNINEVRPALADIDGDGDLDLFIGSRYDYNGNNFFNDIYFFRNIGTPTAPEFSLDPAGIPGLHNQNVGEFSGLAFADIDGDGDLDAISGGSDSLVYFQNIGTATAPSFVRHNHAGPGGFGTPNPNNPFSPFPHASFLAPTPSFDDLDGDGDFDLVYGTESGFVEWIENIGTPTAPNFDLVNYGPVMDSIGGHDFGSFIAMDIADVTNDGVLDIMVCTFQPSAWHWYRGVVPCSPTAASFSVEACPGSTYTVPSGDEMYTTAGVYNDTITNSCGLDSVMTITLSFGDTDLPTALCQNINLYLDAGGNASMVAADIDGGSSDACGIMSMVPSATSFNCSNIGANNVTLMVTDVNSNVNTCSAVVTVLDTISPTAVCQNITVFTDGSGNAIITAADIDGGSSDNCGTPSLSASQTSFTCADLGVNNVTLTATDGSSNSSTCMATVTVIDSTAPTAVCQNITVFLDGSGNATITAADIDGGSSDNCGTPSLSASQTSFTCADLGANNVTLTVTDVSANSSTCAATVTVQDTISPTLTCPGNQNETPDASCNFTLPDYISSLSIASTDNCGATTVTQSPAMGTVISGTTTVTITSVDGSGNTSQCSFDVTLVDATAPTAVCQTATVYLDASGNATLNAVDVDGGSTDNCAGLTLGVSQTAFTCSDLGTNNVTLTVTDGASLTDNCTATVTVVDTISPTAVCQNITAYLDATGNVSITASDVDGGSSDNCGSVSLSAAPLAFTCAEAGANNVTLTVDDGNGNSMTCVAIVTVLDTISSAVSFTAPADMCENEPMLTGLGGGTPSGMGGVYSGSGVTDDGNGMTYSFDPATAGIGIHTLTYAYTNSFGCVDMASDALEVFAIPSVTGLASDALCNGSGDGSITLTVSGSGLSYDWSVDGTGDFNDPQNVSGLDTGSYTLQVMNANGCAVADTFSIGEPAPIQTSASTTDASCYGGTDGTAMISASGGTGSLLEDWGTLNPMMLPEGTHIYTITDDNGCVHTDSVMIAQPDSLQLGATATDEMLGNDGTIDLTVTGGTAPFEFDWDNDGTGDTDDTEDLSGLVSGSYTVIVYDDNGCSETLTIDVGTQVSVNDLNKLSFKVYPNPGTGIFTIELGDNATTNSTVQVMSSVGEIVLEQTLITQTTQLNLEGMSKGVYFVKLTNGDSQKSIKLMLQ